MPDRDLPAQFRFHPDPHDRHVWHGRLVHPERAYYLMKPTATLTHATTWCRIEQSTNNGGFYVTYQATGIGSRRYRDRRHATLADAKAATREWMKRFRLRQEKAGDGSRVAPTGRQGKPQSGTQGSGPD